MLLKEKTSSLLLHSPSWGNLWHLVLSVRVVVVVVLYTIWVLPQGYDIDGKNNRELLFSFFLVFSSMPCYMKRWFLFIFNIILQGTSKQKSWPNQRYIAWWEYAFWLKLVSRVIRIFQQMQFSKFLIRFFFWFILYFIWQWVESTNIMCFLLSSVISFLCI